MFRLSLSAVASLLLVWVAFAAAPPTSPLPNPKVQALIERLGDRDYRTRDAAEAALREEGAAALPHLRKALKHSELEVRRRALRLVPSIETAVTFAPKRVTMRVRNQPLETVLKELSKASGYQIDANGGRFFGGPFGGQPKVNEKAQAQKPKNFSYDFDKVPFWDAVERICKDAGLSVQQSYGDDVVRLHKTGSHAPFVARSGPFRIVANNLQGYRSVDLDSSDNTNNRSETLTLNFTVFSEPRLPFMNAGEVRLDYAYDELKNSLIPRKDLNVDPYDQFGFRRGIRSGRYYGGAKQSSMAVSAALERRSERATTLKSIKGVVPMTVLVKQEPIVLTDKILSAKGVKKEVGDLTLEIMEAKNAGANQTSIKFNITNKRTNDYSWQNGLYNRVELYDDKGNKYQNWGSSWGSSGPAGVQMTLTFSNANVPKPGQPAKFVFIHWETKQYDVEFSFKDVPLP